MKNIFSIVVLGLLTISISNAQENGRRQNRSPEEMTKMQVERLTEALTLNKKQQDSIYKYSLQTSKEQRQIMEKAGDNREASFDKIRVLRDQNDKKIKSFLSEEQVKKYTELAKNRPQREGRRNN